MALLSLPKFLIIDVPLKGSRFLVQIHDWEIKGYSYLSQFGCNHCVYYSYCVVTGSSIPSSYSPELEQVLENDSFVEDGTSSHCSSPSSPEERKTNLRQMFIFDNRTDELISLEDSNADATSQLGNVSFGADSDLMVFSRESLANEGAQNREELTWQTFEYDDEQQTGAATIFYNFEDDS